MTTPPAKQPKSIRFQEPRHRSPPAGDVRQPAVGRRTDPGQRHGRRRACAGFSSHGDGAVSGDGSGGGGTGTFNDGRGGGTGATPHNPITGQAVGVGAYLDVGGAPAIPDINARVGGFQLDGQMAAVMGQAIANATDHGSTSPSVAEGGVDDTQVDGDPIHDASTDINTDDGDVPTDDIDGRNPQPGGRTDISGPPEDMTIENAVLTGISALAGALGPEGRVAGRTFVRLPRRGASTTPPDSATPSWTAPSLTPTQENTTRSRRRLLPPRRTPPQRRPRTLRQTRLPRIRLRIRRLRPRPRTKRPQIRPRIDAGITPSRPVACITPGRADACGSSQGRRRYR